MLFEILTNSWNTFAIFHFQLFERLLSDCVVEVSKFNPAKIFECEILATIQAVIPLFTVLFSIFLSLLVTTLWTFF